MGSTLLVLSCALVFGLGIGHFIGWSEKLELQEIVAEEREVRMEELTDSLVACITGEEGNGGDEPDLEEQVIRQLSEENNVLKLALAKMSKSCQHPVAVVTSPAAAENDLDGNPLVPSLVLRQRINELMVANADLEKEVARLRYAHSAMLEAEATKSSLRDSQSDLLKAKETLNDVNTEIEQLKIVIGKTRYGSPPSELPTAAAELLNDED